LTDALLSLGYIDPDLFLGGHMKLDRKGALAACGQLGGDLSLDAVETAWGVREISLAEMVKATRARLSVRALASADHCLVSYGGCGALFAAEVAQKAGMKRVLVPELASVLSAFGAATMDIRRERMCTLILRLPGDAAEIDRALAEVRAAALRDLEADGVPEADRVVVFEGDMRFAGQRWETTIAFPPEPARGDGGREAEKIFREEYLRRYGAAATTTSGVVELVAVRAIGIGRMATAEDDIVVDVPKSPRPAKACGTRKVNLARGQAPVSVASFEGAKVAPGDFLQGPALIDSSDTTIWIPQGMTARMDAHRTLVIEVTA